MAAPFVEGRLTKKRLSVEVRTECAHCGRPMSLTIGSDLRREIADGCATPLLFEPEIDWGRFVERNIIHAY
jgi:hypothetical protein